MTAAKFAEDRLAQILVAPIVSEKSTMISDKHNQVLFQVLRGALPLAQRQAGSIPA